MIQAKLTVIIPCYNAEYYMDKCVSSIVNQTYTNLEILLINDGSTDQTTILCDKWQEKDSRIRAIHQPNGGPSVARKTGIENSSSDYVTFVDSDDWIDENMYADMMEAILATDSDIAQCGYCKAFEDGHIENNPYEIKNDSFEIFGREDGVLLILQDKRWKSFMWNKIYKMNLFDNIVFPEGLDVAEDFINHTLFQLASQSVYLPKTYYFYFQREGSLLNYNITTQNNIKHKYQFSLNLYNRYLFVKQHPEYKSVMQFLVSETLFYGVIALRLMVSYPNLSGEGWYDSLSRKIGKLPLLLKNNLHIAFKIELFLLKIHPKCFKIIRKLYNLKT